MSSGIAEIERSAAGTIALRAKLFRGLADPSRLSILEALKSGPQSVGGLVKATGLTQPNASNHLRCLSECGLVSAQQQGRFVYYRLSDERLGALLSSADSLLAEVGPRIRECPSYGGSAVPERAHSSALRRRKQP